MIFRRRNNYLGTYNSAIDLAEKVVKEGLDASFVISIDLRSKKR